MTCVRSAMIYGSETEAMTVEQSVERMVRWMCGVSLRERMGIESVSDAVKQNRLRWLGHVLQKDDDDWVKKITSVEVEGKRTGKAKDDIEPGDGKGYERVQVEGEDAKVKMQRLLCRAARPTPA